MTIALIVHGGAGKISTERVAGAKEGCRQAAIVGWDVLQGGSSALDAVEAAVRALEDNPHFNAGRGSCLNRDGKIEMDAGIMDGHTLNVGSVAGIELIQNPITLARRILESEHTFLVGAGAQFFAREQGINPCRYEDLLTERQYNAWKNQTHSSLTYEAKTDTNQEQNKKHGTVGAVAIDGTGKLAAATSTGGIMNKYPGRVGDSPLIGCGFYADEYAAISCTGYGEDFTRLMIAQRAAAYVAQGYHAQQAAEAAIDFLSQHAKGDGGLIIIDRHGNIGKARNSQHLANAYINAQMAEPGANIL